MKRFLLFCAQFLPLASIFAFVAYVLSQAGTATHPVAFPLSVTDETGTMSEICDETMRLDGRPPRPPISLDMTYRAVHPEFQTLYDLACNAIPLSLARTAR